MDGVTDAAFRFIVDKYGTPSVLITEFTNVEGIVRGAVQLMSAFTYHNTDTPTVAQIFGIEEDAFYKTAFALCEMGFSGIDINMGCPDRHIAKKGGGAGLILQPQKAQRIIKNVKQAVKEWANGKTMEDAQLHERIIQYVDGYKKKNQISIERKVIPVSVKTRIGFGKIVTEEWIKSLLEVEPTNISLHGRTLKQLYTGAADWEEIGKAALLAHQTKTLLLGNGDVKSVTDAKEKIKTYRTDGVLIGRAAFGNPWIFKGIEPTKEQLLNVLLEHCEVFMKITPELNFLSLRKHMAWYCRGFPLAATVRQQLMQTRTINDITTIIQSL